MTRILAVAALSMTAAALVAAPLFNTATESKWTATKGSSTIGTATLLTNSSGSARVEWRDSAKAPVRVFLADKNKSWFRDGSGDVELTTYKGADKNAVAALLTADTAAKYTRDAKGPAEIKIGDLTLKRTSVGTSKADASNFVVRPKKSAASRLARLSGDLLGPSQSTVSATAGGRGVGTKGLKLADGGDYGAVEELENRDAAWAEKMSDALAEFQKSGKVGKAREEQQ